MKLFFLIGILLSQLHFGQIKAPIIIDKSSTGKQYSYRVHLYKISNVSYPGKEVQLKLIQNAAILDGDAMLYPEIKSDYGSLSKVCPIIMLGYKKTAFPTDGNCSVREEESPSFRNDLPLGFFTTMKIPANRLSTDTKLVLGIYGAELILSNGKIHRLKKANLRAFRLADFDYSVRNYIKYEVSIDGANITLEYIIERSVIN